MNIEDQEEEQDKMINITFSPVVSEYLKILMKKKGISDTSSSGAKKYLTQQIIKEFESLNLPLGSY